MVDTPLLQKIIRYVDRGAVLIGVVSLAILVGAAFLQVIMRYVFSHALSWPEELCRFFFIDIAYVGIALTMKSNSHLCVDLLATYASPPFQKILKVFALSCSALFLLFLGYLSCEMVLQVKGMNYTASSMPVPIYLTWIPIPVFMCLAALYAILNIFLAISEKPAAR